MGFVLTVCHVLIVFVGPLPIVISLTTSAAIAPVISLSITSPSILGPFVCSLVSDHCGVNTLRFTLDQAFSLVVFCPAMFS